jgi:hypothetical protein
VESAVRIVPHTLNKLQILKHLLIVEQAQILAVNGMDVMEALYLVETIDVTILESTAL